ncbi:MAG: metal ABC transporter ATP-binding protein [Candidatus Auribacterota bacterium]|jgi:zinc transport system ATP-binding protein|nr:metal ABC transporter ATP-binding protein [Candidatus Auribacterota bacterium]
MSSNPVIQFKNVTFSYGSNRILDNVSLSINSGESVCIIGPNGGGKTTLLKIINGLLQPTGGTVTVFGQSPDQVSCRIGYTPQYIYFDPLFPITVRETVLMGRLGAKWGGPYTSQDKQAARESLNEMGVIDLEHRLFSSLSGGQRQRVLIARSLSCKPDILLLDEPTANIDAIIAAKLYDTLQRLSARMSILMVSHDISIVSTIFQRVLCVNHNVREHTTEDISDTGLAGIYGSHIRMVRHTPYCIPGDKKNE